MTLLLNFVTARAFRLRLAARRGGDAFFPSLRIDVSAIWYCPAYELCVVVVGVDVGGGGAVASSTILFDVRTSHSPVVNVSRDDRKPNDLA